MWLTTEFMEMRPCLTQLLRAATTWPGSRWALAPEAGKADLADHAGWGEGSSTCAWAEAREDQKGVLGRHRRLGGLGCHRRRSLTAHRWRGSRHATRGSPGGGDFVHMAAPLGLRGGGGGRSHRRPHLRPQLAPMPEHRRRRPRRLNDGRGHLRASGAGEALKDMAPFVDNLMREHGRHYHV